MKELHISSGNGKYCGGKFAEGEKRLTIKEAGEAWKSIPKEEKDLQAWRDNPNTRFPCGKCLGEVFKAKGIKARRLLTIHLQPEDAVMNVDPSRLDKVSTGIYVRAKHEGSWGSYDIYELKKESLLAWLRSRGGDNPWAENTVGILLGHENLHPPAKGETS